MPCYTVRTMSVEFKAEHRDLLEQAIKNLGWKYTRLDTGLLIDCDDSANSMRIDLVNSKATITADQQPLLNLLKRTYSVCCLQRVTAKNNWTLTRSTATKGSLIKSYS